MGQGMCVPESFCTHQNASSVEFLETGLTRASTLTQLCAKTVKDIILKRF